MQQTSEITLPFTLPCKALQILGEKRRCYINKVIWRPLTVSKTYARYSFKHNLNLLHPSPLFFSMLKFPQQQFKHRRTPSMSELSNLTKPSHALSPTLNKQSTHARFNNLILNLKAQPPEMFALLGNLVV